MSGGLSSAEPAQLARFADLSSDLEVRLIGTANDLGVALDALRTSGSWQLPPIPALDQRLDGHARGALENDVWVGRVGKAFEQADLLGGLGVLFGGTALALDTRLDAALANLNSGLTPEQWRHRAHELAGIDPATWDPARGLAANDANVQAVYALYGQLMIDHPELQWAGMAHIAGGLFYAGWQDLYVAGQLADPVDAIREILPLDFPGPVDDWILDHLFPNLAGSFASDEIDWFLGKFLDMQKQIFDDMAWQHIAYSEGGIAEMRRLAASGQLPPELLDAWEDIASGEPDRVAAGNEVLLIREQRQIIQPDYDEMRAHHGPVGEVFTRVLTWTAQSPIPGGRDNGDVVNHRLEVDVPCGLLMPLPALVFGCPSISVEVPRGNIADFNDRWEWISGDMLPAYRDLIENDPAHLDELLHTPVAELADGHRMIPLPYHP